MNSDILYQIKKNSLSEIRNKDKTSSIYVLEFYMVENIKKFLEEKNIKPELFIKNYSDALHTA